MTKFKLTKTAVEGIDPPAAGERIVWDSEQKGFGVRVSSQGRATYFIYGRTAGARQIKLKVGVHGQITAEQARAIAKTMIGKLMAGHDLSEERRQKRAIERTRRDAPTVRELGDEYLTDHAETKKRASSVKDDRAMLEIVYSRIGAKRVSDVSHKEIEALHRELRATPYRANRVVALLSKAFGLAVKWGYRLDNPATGIERYQEPKRERYLRPDEIARLRAALDDHPERPSANAVRLLLLTGARRMEVLGATWDQFDLDAGTWTKPSATTKQKAEHVVPLSPPAVKLLKEIRAAAEDAQRKAKTARWILKRSPFVFPSAGGDGHMSEIKKFWRTVCTTAKIKGVRLHDLRHTFASVLAGEKLSLPIIGQLLGHTQASTTQRYAHLFDGVTRKATNAAAARLGEYEKAPRKGKLVVVKR